METINQTKFPLRPLLDFLQNQFAINLPVKLMVLKQDRECMTEGWTGLMSNKNIYIKLWVSAKMRYPHTTSHVPAVPAVQLNSWQEEFILVAAHELRHAYQMGSGVFQALGPAYAEVDAERYAERVLERYRNSY